MGHFKEEVKISNIFSNNIKKIKGSHEERKKTKGKNKKIKYAASISKIKVSLSTSTDPRSFKQILLTNPTHGNTYHRTYYFVL